MAETYFASFGEALKMYRKKKKITQRLLADCLGVHYNTIWAWERGDYLPNTRNIVLEIAMQLHLGEVETRSLLEACLMDHSVYWAVPYLRNMYFTGREEILCYLHQIFTLSEQEGATRSCALTGLGGIGKTQVALEYAYRYSLKHAAILWMNASTAKTIEKSLGTISKALRLSSEPQLDHLKTLELVVDWLNQHHNWLLIVDNVQDIELTKEFLPVAYNGCYLFTTQLPALGMLASCLELPSFSEEESVQFLLHRISRTPFQLDKVCPDELVAARTLATYVAGLPLALDQIGAYIEETHSNLQDFLPHFQSHPIRILSQRHIYTDHPDSVVKMLTLAFERLQKSNEIAAKLLILCCFLSPDPIPTRLMHTLLASLQDHPCPEERDPLAYDRALRDMLACALIRRHTQNNMFMIHPVVRATVQECLSDNSPQTVNAHLLSIVNQVFPLYPTDSEEWCWCAQILPHALCVTARQQQWDASSSDTLSLLLKLAQSHFHRSEVDRDGSTQSGFPEGSGNPGKSFCPDPHLQSKSSA